MAWFETTLARLLIMPIAGLLPIEAAASGTDSPSPGNGLN